MRISALSIGDSVQTFVLELPPMAPPVATGPPGILKKYVGDVGEKKLDLERMRKSLARSWYVFYMLVQNLARMVG